LLLAAAGEARAQPADRTLPGAEPVGRAYGALFGQDSPVTTGDGLVFIGSLAGGYDDNVYAGAGAGSSSRRQVGGTLGVASGRLVYGRTTGRMRVGAGALGSAQYSPAFEKDYALTGAVDGQLNYDMTNRWSVGVGGRVGYRDRLRLTRVPGGPDGDSSGLPGAEGELDGEGGASEQPSVFYHGRGNLSYRSSPRGTFTASASASHVDYLDRDERHDVWGAGAHYRYRVTPHFTSDVGYDYREGSYSRPAGPDLDSQNRTHSITVGGDYTRPLSASRRTYLTLGFGSAAFSQERALGDPRQRWRFIGNARVNHEIGRSWQVAASYRRGMQWVFYAPEPVFADDVSAMLSGHFSRQWSLTTMVGYSNGQLAATARDRSLDRFGSTVRLQYAITRNLATFAQYLYYYYRMDPLTALQVGISPEYDRNGFRVGLTTIVPLLR
jgi:opacity protein-like surface antigen